MKKLWKARQHFNHIAKKYDHYRTLDKAPIDFLAETVRGTEQSICDLGSGTGRYLIALIKAFQSNAVVIKEVYGIDISHNMLETAEHQMEGLKTSINWVLASADNTGLRAQSISLVTAFNSIHHLPILKTMDEVERILIPGGYFAIYCRILDQESEHIWGRWFPGYLDYSQVQTREFMTNFGSYNKGFQLLHVQNFTFERKTTLAWICEQTENRYYSTLDRYTRKEFNKAYSEFLDNIRANHSDLDEITYYSSYSLFLYQLSSIMRGKLTDNSLQSD